MQTRTAGPVGPAAADPHAFPKAPHKQTTKGKVASVAVCPKPGPNQATCLSKRRTDVSAVKGLIAGSAPVGYGPSDLRSAYALPDGGGAGQTIAVVDAYDDPNAESDLALYRQQYGLPACTTANGCFRKADQRGGTDYPVAAADWAGEISLDLDMISAIAPNAHILLVEADSPSMDDLGTAVDESVALGAKYVSNSYSGAEDPSEVQDDALYFQHPGVAVVASSGDGYYGTQYPAASPYVTAVGGTSLAHDPSSARGWTETVWDNNGGPGSGCSAYEPKPAQQKDTGCPRRSVADVAADADPATGPAVYDTYQQGGWLVGGGTSAASPIVAAVYADAGTPAAASYPNAYPYQATSALNDVTEGSNGGCTPAYLCTAGPGYDGPTGLGTPHGLDAFRSGPHGEVIGTVTDKATGKPVAGATVTAGDSSATTGTDGTYALSVRPGTVDVTAAAYAYRSTTVSAPAVTDGATLTQDIALTPLPSATVRGRITDGSGHGYPLDAQISVDGRPGAPVHTDPATGAFRIALPQHATYRLEVTADYPGYTPTASTVAVGASNVTDNVQVPVNASTCNAPGYQVDDEADPPACSAVAGGLVVGRVTDANTGDGIAGASVTGADDSGAHAGSSAAANAEDSGSYWLFSAPGTHPFTAAGTHYTSAGATVGVKANKVVTADFVLKAGRLAVSPAALGATVTSGKQATATVTVRNTGGEPASLHVDEATGSFSKAARGGAPLQRLAGTFTNLPPEKAPSTLTRHPAAGAADAAAWQSVPDYPTTIEDPATGYDDGTVYVVGGWANGSHQTAAMYSYNATAGGGWKQLASAPAPREAAYGAFLGGKLYLTGGWDQSDVTDPRLDVYDPATGSWSTGAAEPQPRAGAAGAVLDGKLYLVGGCSGTCAPSTTVSVYDPATDNWSSAAPYPEAISFAACGAVDGLLYCAGGLGQLESRHAYVYDPATDTWAQIADLPQELAGSAYTAANGQFLVSGGTTLGAAATTNQGFAYDPATGQWKALPNALTAHFRGGSALGFYQVGGVGAIGGGAQSEAEVLPGYDQAVADVPWLSENRTEVTLAPGASAKIKVTLDAAGPSAAAYGTYTAALTAVTDTPHTVPSVPVTLTVAPPASYGKLTGTVRADDGTGGTAPLAGATVQIVSSAAAHTLLTGSDGGYALWADSKDNPYQVIVAKDGYQPQALKVKLRRGVTTSLDVVLKAD